MGIGYTKLVASFLTLDYAYGDLYGSQMSIIKIYIIFSMLAVLWSDVRKYIIPNWLVGSLLVLYPIGVWFASHEVNWEMAIVSMLMVFAAGYFIFSMRWMGAGDIKLMTVCALWVGYEYLLDYIVIVALLGGILSIILWGGRKIIAAAGKLPLETLPRVLQEGAPAPYGIAIAIGFLIFLFTDRIPLLVGA
jgi:prepilin peptidase CpaA